MMRRFISAKGDAASVILLVAGLLTFPSMALADVPMFVVVSLLKLNAFPLLALVVLIEAVALRWIYPAPWGRSIRTALYANAFSMAVGLLAYPLVGAILYPVLAPLVLGHFGVNTSVEIVATLLVVSVVDTVIELPFVAAYRKVRITVRAIAIFLAANVLGMVLMAAALTDWEELTEPSITEEEVARLESHYAPEIAFMRQVYDELKQVFSETPRLTGTDWLERTSAEAADYRFRRLNVGERFAYDLVYFRDLHSTSGRRGDGSYVRDDVEIWRTMSQDGVWYYVYSIRASWRPQSIRISAWLDRP